MAAPFSGGCACKAVRYSVSAEPIAVFDCHCRDCQYASGGATTTCVVVPRDAFALTEGLPKRYSSKTDTGSEISRLFCGECGSPLFSDTADNRIWIIKAASLDDPSWLKLSGALYTDSKQPWAHVDHDLLMFPKMPTR